MSQNAGYIRSVGVIAVNQPFKLLMLKKKKKSLNCFLKKYVLTCLMINEWSKNVFNMFNLWIFRILIYLLLKLLIPWLHTISNWEESSRYLLSQIHILVRHVGEIHDDISWVILYAKVNNNHFIQNIYYPIGDITTFLFPAASTLLAQLMKFLQSL